MPFQRCHDAADQFTAHGVLRCGIGHDTAVVQTQLAFEQSFLSHGGVFRQFIGFGKDNLHL